MGLASILVSVFVSNGLGFLWWSPGLFGKIWAECCYPGKSFDEIGKDCSPYVHLSAGIAHAAVALLIQLLMAMLHLGSLSTLICLIGALSGIVIMTQIPHHLYGGKHIISWFIEQGYDLMKIIFTCVIIYYLDYVLKLPF
ncbi:DgyrCDS982 [Dimorphilus gyrociliatus]|uniref:DgyrCDS982 n=1 Tax=Dimorphilus gyrociliatus TaxID=2664684 RepID=A0A7I8V909_9ANNE|nr:DgyrCDS982 [Dimorphilus gyrociliatus]